MRTSLQERSLRDSDVSYTELMIELLPFVCVDGQAEELRGPQGGVTGDDLVGVSGLLHCVLLLCSVDYLQLRLPDHLTETQINKEVHCEVKRLFTLAF